LFGTTTPSLAATGACGRGRFSGALGAAPVDGCCRALLGVPLTGGAPPPTLITTLRRTTTPSAELDNTTGGRRTPPGLTMTTGFDAAGAAAIGAGREGAAGGNSGCA